MALNRLNNGPPLAGFDEFFAPSPFIRDPSDDWMPVIRNLDRDLGSMIRRSSPGYEISETEDKYKIAVDIPGVKFPDINVQVGYGGRVLHISGGCDVITDDGKTTKAKFDKCLTVGNDVDVTKISAELSDDMLTLAVPKVKKEEAQSTKIEVTENQRFTNGNGEE